MLYPNMTSLTDADYKGFGEDLTFSFQSLNSSDISKIEERNFSLIDHWLDLYSRNLSSSSAGQLILKPANVIALTLSVISIIANLGTLIAIANIRGLMTANLRLIISLSISDMLVSISSILQYATAGITPFGTGDDNVKETCIFLVLRSLRMMSHIISLLNLLGLALDHYFAIVRPLEYPRLMCHKRVNIMISIFWLLSFLSGFSDFYVPAIKYSYCEGLENVNYCETVYCTAYDSEYLVFIMAIVLLLVMCFLYTRIYFKIHRYQSFEGRHGRHIRRNKKGLVTTFLILGTFMTCWLPYCIFELFITIQMLTNFAHIFQYFKLVTKLDFYLYDLLLLNSLCDNIIYAVRMREVQHGYKRVLRLCLSNDQTIKLRVRFSLERHSSQTFSTMSTTITSANSAITYNKQASSARIAREKVAKQDSTGTCDSIQLELE